MFARGAFKSRGQLQRLALFAAASLALHGLTLGVYVPGGPARPNDPALVRPALQATLLSTGRDRTPDEASPPAGTDQIRDSNADAAGAPAHPRGSPDTPRLPGPDRWYSASELDLRAEPVTPVEFNYPPNVARIIGRVRIALFIDERGVVRKAHVLESQPESLFDEAALSGWREVRFSPAMRGGIPVKSQKVVDVDFQPELR